MGWVGGVAQDSTQTANPTGFNSSSKSSTSGTVDKAKPSESGAPQDQVNLSSEARQEVAKLKARDQQVRTHEAAHMAAGGSLVRGGATYSYQRGPDGAMYAVGGEVTLDTSEVPNNPRATMAKAEQIKAAALAPADPSSQDRSVAAQAASMEAKASAELAKQTASAVGGTSSSGASSPAGGKEIGSLLNLLA